MKVFRISLYKWSGKLTASGNPGRWNSKGNFVVYTAGSRALACLENVVHRSGDGFNDNFNVMVIEIPPRTKIIELKKKDLPNEWYEYKTYLECQKIGDNWISKSETVVLKVPSSIIVEEYNYLINPGHEDFKSITLIEIEDFER